jgi:hypothetical protein
MPIIKKGDRRDPKNYRGINILNTCYKIYSKILNMKLQSYSEEFMTGTQNRFQKDVHKKIRHSALTIN